MLPGSRSLQGLLVSLVIFAVSPYVVAFRVIMILHSLVDSGVLVGCLLADLGGLSHVHHFADVPSVEQGRNIGGILDILASGRLHDYLSLLGIVNFCPRDARLVDEIVCRWVKAGVFDLAPLLHSDGPGIVREARG